jgi:peroxiredoxin
MNIIYRKIYIIPVFLLVLFFTCISKADQVSDKPNNPIALPEVFEAINDPITLNAANIFYNQNDEVRSFDSFENRFLVIHFWASWCMECLNELITLNELQRVFRKKALTVITISEDFKGAQAIDEFFTKHKIDYLDIYLDKRNKIYQSLNINHLPATYLMDFQGNVIARSKPSTAINWMDNAIVRYLDEKVVNVQLLPPEYKQMRDLFEAPKPAEKKSVIPKKEENKNKKTNIFIN